MRNLKILFTAAILAATPFALTSTAQAQTAHEQPRHNQPAASQAHPQMHGHKQPQQRVQHEQRNKSDAWRREGGRMPHGRGSVVSDYRQYNLRAPPRGYHWVRDGDRYILVGITSGIISSILSVTN